MAYFPPDTCVACESLAMPRFRRVVKEVLWTSALSESTGQNYKHIAIQKLQRLTLESPSPINTLLSIGIRI